MKIDKNLAEKAFFAIADFIIDCKIEKEYKSDISSYAPSIIQAGLMTTVIFYQIPPKDGNDLVHIRKNKINNSILAVLKFLYNDTDNSLNTLYDYVKLKDSDLASRRILLNKIEQAIGAIKLTIRFYQDK